MEKITIFKGSLDDIIKAMKEEMESETKEN